MKCHLGQRMGTAAVLSVVVLSAVQTGVYADWPMYGGANRNGISEETGWKVWKDAPKIAWKKDVDSGYSSVSVVGGRVYTMGGRNLVWCLNAADGSVVWRYPQPEGPKAADAQKSDVKTAGTKAKGEKAKDSKATGLDLDVPGDDDDAGVAKVAAKAAKEKPAQPARQKSGGETLATPSVSDGLVYALGKEGQLLCLDAATGKLQWSKNLGSEFGVKWGGWKAACSPLVLGDKLVMDVGKMLVLEKKTGNLVWQAGSDTASYSSAAAFKSGNNTYLTSFNASGLAIYDLATSKEVARSGWKTAYDVNAGTPIVSGDKIFLSTGYGRGCTLLALGADGLKPVYENTQIASHAQTCVLLDGYIYGVSGQQGSGGSIKCLEFAGGKVKWEQGGIKVGGGLIVADKKIVALLDGGELLIADASPDGFKQLARGKVLDGKCWTAPVLDGGCVYCRNYDGDLVCVDLR